MFYRKIRGKGKRSVTNGDAAFFRTRKRAANTFTRIEKKESGIRAYTVRYILYSKYPDVRSNILPVKKKSRARERDFLIRGNKNTNENVLRRESCLSKLERKGRNPRPRGLINLVSVKALYI